MFQHALILKIKMQILGYVSLSEHARLLEDSGGSTDNIRKDI
jgi:hypothetical protein